MFGFQERALGKRIMYFHNRMRKSYRHAVYATFAAMGEGIVAYNYSDDNDIQRAAYLAMVFTALYFGKQIITAKVCKKEKKKIEKELQRVKSDTIDNIINNE